MSNRNIDEEIEKAEQAIFKNASHFNEKQKVFLKCFDACCVQAYAGTGKTCTIVGKLHILAQRNVWQNGRGICVISHTNVAVDEIKKHVAVHYPAIMKYPNFIGTIQEFVNKFLFLPYLASKGHQIRFQDESRYFDYKNELQDPTVKERIDNKLSQLCYGRNPASAKKDLYDKLKTLHINGAKLYAKARNGGYREFRDLKTNAVPQNKIVESLSQLIRKSHDNGYFLFVESFVYGNEYLEQNQLLKAIISQRFQYVFLDEAQDCSEIQLQVLTELFGEHSSTVFQQIGDVNQAISETKWMAKAKVLTMKQSTRFGNNIAAFINEFQAGDGSGVSGTSEVTKKYLIIYEAGKEKEVLKKFSEILKNKDISDDKGFFAIAHRHKHLTSYFPEYSEKLAKNKRKIIFSRFNSDNEYINMLTKEAVLQQGSHVVSKAITSLLYKHYKSGGNSWSKLRELLRIGEKADKFKKIIIQISNDILQNGFISDLKGLETALNTILAEDKINFTKGDPAIVYIQKHAKIKENKYNDDGIEINIGTIHSIKGQTHSSTLLFSNKEEGKQDIQHTRDDTPTLTPKFKRLIYVASSRAKYLFGLAIEAGVYDSLVDEALFNDFETIKL